METILRLLRGEPLDGVARELGVTAATLAQGREQFLAGGDVKVVNRIVNDRGSVTAEMALKFGAVFWTMPEFWINAQQAVDLHHAVRRMPSLPKPVLRAG